MKTHQKAAAWGKEFLEIFKGPVIGLIYKKPPAHYLGYVIDGKVPVVLVPGVTNTWAHMKKLSDEISMMGHPVHIVPELGYNLESIPASASLLQKVVTGLMPQKNVIHRRTVAIKNYIAQKNLKGVVLVAHSKGGLIGKYFLAHHNSDHRVIGMVAVATPFSGSAMAKLMPHGAFRELELDSKIIADLKEHKDVNKKIISIYPAYDTHVRAPMKSHLEGAENIEIPIGGHTILGNKKVKEAVIGAIESITRW